MNHITLKKSISCLFSLLMFASVVKAGSYNITQFGATGDGETINTKNIQKAIDKCAADGGGRVIIPQGRFLTGSLRLRSGVGLYLDKGGILLGSTKRGDYDKNVSYALLLADEQHDISISGEGTIDGQGRELAADVIQAWKQGLLTENTGKNRPDEKYRPLIIDFEHCTNVTLKGITLKDASCWVENYNQCKNLVMDHVKVNSTAYWNNDGIDIVDCDGVRITNCDINSADDGICLKSSDQNASCNNINVENCKIRSSASAIKFGTASVGGFKNVVIRNIYVYDTYRSAIALECVDGGVIKNILIENIKGVNTGNAIFLRLGKRNKGRPAGSISNVVIKKMDVQVPGAKPDKGYEIEGPVDREPYNYLPSSIVGLPGSTIDNVLLEDINIDFEGGGDRLRAYTSVDSLQAIPERPSNYPEFSMFGELPAWGLYIRHAGAITLKNVKISKGKADYRPAIVADDVNNITLDNLSIKQTLVTKPVIVLHQINKPAFIKPALPADYSIVIK